MLELARVVKAQEQVVAGTLHHLTLEVIDAGEKKIYQAKVWVKPWMNFKELQEFTHIHEPTTTTPSDLGVKKDESKVLHDDFEDAANSMLLFTKLFLQHFFLNTFTTTNRHLSLFSTEVPGRNCCLCGKINHSIQTHQMQKTSLWSNRQCFLIQNTHFDWFMRRNDLRETWP